VPRISAFYGIVITMYFDDHEVPHFHARYAGDTASIAIATGAVLAGRLPRRALRLARSWAVAHRGELELNWHRARRNVPLVPIAPLP